MKKVIVPVILMIALVTGSWASVLVRVNENKVTIEKLVTEAEYNINLQVYSKAMEIYWDLIKIDPDTIDHYHNFMNLAYITNDIKGFEKICDMTMGSFPENPVAYEELAKYYLQKGYYKRAQDIALTARDNVADNEQFKELFYQAKYHYSTQRGVYEEVGNYVGNYSRVKKGEYWGIVDKFGNYAIKPNYENIGSYSKGIVPVTKNGEVYFINDNEQRVLASIEKIDMAMPFIGGLSVIRQGDLYGYANTRLEPKDVKWEFATSYLNNVAAVKSEGKWALRDMERNMITEFVLDDVLYDENLICSYSNVVFAKQGDKFYLFNINGEKVIDQGFDDAKPFTEAGIAAVKHKGKWGFISSNGDKVIEPKYEDAHSFQIGLAPVKQNGKWKYINSNEEVLIEGHFDDARTFSKSGFAAVKDKGLWSFIYLDSMM